MQMHAVRFGAIILQCIRLEEWYYLRLAIFKIALLDRGSGVLSFSQWSTRCVGSIVAAVCVHLESTDGGGHLRESQLSLGEAGKRRHHVIG